MKLQALSNIEGAHSLGIYKTKELLEVKSVDDFDEDKRTEFKNTMLDRIAIIKGQKPYQYQGKAYYVEHTPFYLTLSHHFNNLISGHAKSFVGFGIFNQKNGMDGELTSVGETIVEALLRRDNGRRIIIDTKHMSIETRKAYHQMAMKMDVPILCSHTAVNGVPTYEKAIADRDKNRDKDAYISRMDINLTDEDIEDIYKSKGIIGVCMHDGRMPGGKFKNLIEALQDEWENYGEALINRFYAQMFLTNVFHIVKVNKTYIEQKSDDKDITTAWDTVCLGTDFDGIIDPFNHLNTAATLEDFKSICINALEFRDSEIRKREGNQILIIDDKGVHPYDKDLINELMMGYTPKELMDKVFSLNMINFLKRYYNSDYLIQTT